MKRKGLNLWLVLLCLMMVQMACFPLGKMSNLDILDQAQFDRDPDGYCERWPDDERCEYRFVDTNLAVEDPEAFCKKYPKHEWCETEDEPDPGIGSETNPTLETSEIQPVITPVLTSGACAWVLTADSDGYPSGEIKEGMRVGAGDIKTSLSTYFSHGKSDCGEQVFETYHAWYVEEIYYPGENANLMVVFSWHNNGTADCASLAMAGGSTALSVGDLQIKAQSSNINIRTDPGGQVTDSEVWKVPDGDVGDTMTITQNVSTGIFGKNIRWRYEYVCE